MTRASTFAGALTCIGAVPARALLRHAWRDPAHAPAREVALQRLARWALGASLLVTAAVVLALRAQALSLVDEGETLELLHYRSVLASGWALGWKAQLAAGLLAVIAWMPWRGRPFVGPKLAPIAALALAGTLPLMGHPRVLAAGPVVGVLLGAFHLLGGGLWLGALVHLAAVGWLGDADRRLERVTRLFRAFSPLALTGAATVALTGLGSAWQTVGSLAALAGSGYGRTLLVKLGVLAVIVATGAYNWRVAQPRLATGTGDELLHRSAYVELALGAALIVVTSVLVALPAPGLD
ncbi:MAG TPA: CopD family protein [Gemmatimonadales bacterium]|nr:CopD family protein [Gemmatimonadales bacterium]